jgi:predicted GH43/DUF377 family glycosyl hydrolase
MKPDAGIDKIAKDFATPYKLDRPVLSPSTDPDAFDSRFVDLPYIYRHGDSWYMTYVGFNGQGYKTGLAVSSDLVTWKKQGIILDWGRGSAFDSCGAAATWILRDNAFVNPVPLTYEGKYWMTYYGNNDVGLEAGVGHIGMAFSDDLLTWHKYEGNPILKCSNGDDWEKGSLYKGCLLRHNGKFYLFYNAKNKQFPPWKEQIGLATSEDLSTWERHPGNPILPNSPDGWDSIYTADPQVVSFDGLWVMFYYGYGGYIAQNGLALSEDLITWKKHREPLLRTSSPVRFDDQCAHKPFVIRKDGIVYHFYVAVGESSDTRHIAVATSEPL